MSVAFRSNTINLLTELINTFDVDDEAFNDLSGFLTVDQFHMLQRKGFCDLDRETTNKTLCHLIIAFIRDNLDDNNPMNDIIELISKFHGINNPNPNIYILIKLANSTYFLTMRRNLTFSGKLNQFIDEFGDIQLDEKQVSVDTFQHVLEYLGHHQGNEPDPLPCPIRSIHMSQIVSDQWDAFFIDAFDKKTVFNITIIANDLGIQSLVHLCCAKVATLIKQLDQKEINRVIEEEERYRRSKAIEAEQENGGDDQTQGLTKGLDEDGDAVNDGDLHRDL